MRVKPLLYILLIFILAGCGTSKFLKPCQIIAIDGFGKGMATIGSSYPAIAEKVNDLSLENIQMEQATFVVDTPAQSHASIMNNLTDTIAESISQTDLINLNAIDQMQGAWILCSRYVELLKAITNPDNGKTFSATAETWTPSVDSIVSKYSLCFPNTKVNAGIGPLFSALAQHLGDRKLKRKQKEYVTEAVDSAKDFVFIILETVRTIQVAELQKDINSLKVNYFENYKTYQLMILEDSIKAEKRYDLLKEITEIKKKISYLNQQAILLNQVIIETENLFLAFQTSLHNNLKCEDLSEMKRFSEELNTLINSTSILNEHSK
jgi:hypothetical protein